MVQSADIYLGATVDARKDLPGWDLPGFDTQNWERAHIFTDPGIQRVPQRNEPIRILQQLKPINAARPKRLLLFDFGQNMVGFCSMPSMRVRDQLSNWNTAKFSIHRANSIRKICAKRGTKPIFIADGRGARWFQPFFTYHGFRYVRVSGLSRTPRPG
jgi:alpha-L-rhamnosidase